MTVTSEHGRQETPGTPQGNTLREVQAGGRSLAPSAHGGHSGASLATKTRPL